MDKLNFIELIRLNYKDFLLDKLIEKSDDDFDEVELEKQIDTSKFDEAFIKFINDNKEDLVSQFLAQELDDDDGEISVEVEESEENPEKLNIEIIRVEISGDTDYIYTSFHQSLSTLDLARLQSALINGDASLLEKHVNALIKKEGNKIEVEEETAIYKYHITFDLEKIEHIENIESNLDKCIIVFYECLNDDEDFLEF